MARLRKLTLLPLFIVGALAASAAPVLGANVCPVIGGPGNPQIHGTPAEVPNKDGNPAHGPTSGPIGPGDVFWN